MHTVTVFLICATILVLAQPAAAFGAGDIPDFAWANDRAYRHGDIENILSTLAKSVGGAASSEGLMGLAASVLSAATGGSKFSKMDVKRVYFGNWLRDYSQAMDIAGLSKLTAQTLVTVVTVLGFMTFGFATAEFEVTADRLGVYLPIEHIDNPKGYAEKEGDAREFHPKLRPPVDPQELEINPRNGMKNYIATEGESWDTSTAHVRRTLQRCIEYGRRARGQENNDQWEAFRLLGTALHTLEDLLAHSNWCELGLRKLGHEEVFCHVGDEVIIDTPHGQAPPLITGTFGSADFMHSVLGEGMDHLSEASVTNLTTKMDDAKNQGEGPISTLKSLFSKLPSTGDSSNEERMEQAEDIKNQAYNFNPDDVAPADLQKQLWQVLEWRDGVYRDILNKIEMIPGLSELMDELTNALNAYVFTVLEPVLKPMLQQATGVLQDGSKAVIDTDDQFEVFNDPNASDPSHSMLSKDHFGLILNEPAGKIAQVVVEYSVNLIVKAWYDEGEDPGRVIDQILEVFHHPYFATGNSEIQRLMMDGLERWFGGLGPEEEQKILQALTKDSVRAGKNKRFGSPEDDPSGGQEIGGGYEGEQQSGHGDSYGTGHDGVRYKPNPPSRPTYARYDGQQSDKSERSRHEDEADGYSRTSYGEGRRDETRHVARNEYSASEELDSRRTAEPSPGYGAYGGNRYSETRVPVEAGYGTNVVYGQSREESYSRERHTESRYTESGGYGDNGGGRGEYAPRQEYTSESHNEGRGEFAARQAFPSEAHRGTYNGGRETYNPSYDGGEQSYDGGNQAYAGNQERQTYGGDQSYGGTQSYDGGNQPSYGGGEAYGETQSYSAPGQVYEGNEEPSYGRAEGYTGEEVYGGGPYGEGAAYGGETNYSGGQQRQGYGRGGDSETFGAERLSLDDNVRRHGQHGYGRGLRRGVNDYFPQ